MLKMKWMGVLVLALLGSGCVGFYGTRSTYGGQGGAEVNGAVVSMAVKPEGTSGGSYAVTAMVVGVAVANLDGPFRWRIEAEGKEGVHEALYVQRLRTVTALSAGKATPTMISPRFLLSSASSSPPTSTATRMQ